MTANTTPEPALGHAYDGIREYDNPLPGWWKWIFIASIVASPLYFVYFHSGTPGRSIAEQYQDALSENTRKQYEEIGTLQPDEPTFLKYLNDSKWLAVGNAIFQANCISCHASDGGGSVGPNLCDESFKHIKQLTDIHKVIENGVAGGAMPAWGKRLGHPNDVILVSVYVASLRGSKPANGKAPDGVGIPPWPKLEMAP